MAAFYAGSITSNFKFTTKVPLLLKATSNDEKPTQGYDLQEMMRISKSSLSNCHSLLTFLLGRLEKKDPRIKFKVLHIMKYLVINGPSEFKSQLSHNAEPVKQTINFKGELDPVHGDELNIKVQQTALELEKLLFDVDNPEIENISKSMLAPDPSSQKMQGFGVTQPLETNKGSSLMDTLMKVKKSGSEIFNMNKTKPRYEFNDYEPTSLTSQPQYTPVDLADSGIQPSHESGFGDEVEENEKVSDEIDSEIDSDHFYERKLVNTITAEAGVTKIPSKEVLKDFVNKSSSLELAVILDLLDQRLQHPSLNVQLKSLCVIEYLLRSNLPNIPHEVNEHCSSIHLLAESQDHTQILAKAKKIALTVGSCLKQTENNEVVSRVLVPPCYNEAKQLPEIKTGNKRDTEPKVAKNTNFDSLFSGMNLSAQKLSPVSNLEKPKVIELDSSASKSGTSAEFGGNCKLVEVNESLIDIENSANNISPENSAMFDTNRCNSIRHSTEVGEQTTCKANEDTFESVSNTQSHSNVSELMDLQKPSTSFQNNDLRFLETDESKSKVSSCEGGKNGTNKSENELNILQPMSTACNTPQQNPDICFLQETAKRSVILKPATGVLDSKNGELLNWESSNTDAIDYRASSTQNTENLLLLNTEQHNQNSSKSVSQQLGPINPQRTIQVLTQNPNSDLLSFPPEPRPRILPGGLELPNNSNPRRPFPKDMKSEVDGFDFIKKSSKSDAFSFISDEIQARKTKPK